MVAFRTSVTGGNNNTSATITVPATCQVGDVFILHLSLNNTDNINSFPANLIQLDYNNFTSSGYPNYLYYGVVDGTNISAGTVLTWPLAATRSWTINLYVATGVNTTAPVRGIWTMGSLGTTVILNSGFPVSTSWMLEIISGKSNGTAITSWTAPVGWTVRSTATANTTTFQGSSAIADYDAGLAPAGTYGGETYVPNSTPGAYISYIVALNPDPVGGSSVTSPTSWVKA